MPTRGPVHDLGRAITHKTSIRGSKEVLIMQNNFYLHKVKYENIEELYLYPSWEVFIMSLYELLIMCCSGVMTQIWKMEYVFSILSG